MCCYVLILEVFKCTETLTEIISYFCFRAFSLIMKTSKLNYFKTIEPICLYFCQLILCIICSLKHVGNFSSLDHIETLLCIVFSIFFFFRKNYLLLSCATSVRPFVCRAVRPSVVPSVCRLWK